MPTTISQIAPFISWIHSLKTREKWIHAMIWLGGLIFFNLPFLAITIGLFHSNDYSLLLPSLYGTFLNACIFYVNSWLILQYFKQRPRLFFSYSLGLFGSLTLFEFLLDICYFYVFYDSVSWYQCWEILLGSFLMNGLFFYLPSFLFGIMKDWQQEKGREGSLRDIHVRDGHKDIFLKPYELHFVESDGNYSIFQTYQGKIVERKSLAKVEEMLSEHEFVRCHRSFIINVNQIRQMNSKEVEIMGQKIPIGRTYKEKLKGLMEKRISYVSK